MDEHGTTEAEDKGERDDDREAVGAGRTLGVERWVQFGVIAACRRHHAFGSRTSSSSSSRAPFAEPDATIVAAADTLVGIIGAFYAYKREDSNTIIARVRRRALQGRLAHPQGDLAQHGGRR